VNASTTSSAICKLSVDSDEQSDVANGMRHNVWFVCPGIGRPSEPWLSRQVLGFHRLRARVVCWERANGDFHLSSEVPLHLMDFPARPMNGPGRWWIRLRNLPGGNFYGTVGRERAALEELVAETAPHVILCQFGHSALRLLPVAQSGGVPLVAHFHGLDVSSSLVEDRWYRWSLLRNLSRFAAIVVVGEHQEKWMLDHGVPRERLHLIPCGAPVSEYNAEAIRAADRVRFMAVSRLVAWKGVDLTIRAFAEVAAKIREAELLIVGEGPERAALQALAVSLGVADRVTFAGACSSAEVRKYYETSHIFVQHSISHASGWVEGFGVTIVEAAAAGLPVVVSRSGGIGPQVVHGETGFLVKERDVVAMAKTMTTLAENPELRTRMGLQGRKHVESHFDSQKQIEKLEDVLLGVADRALKKT
jgi:colanic acid/amylovoran biosynthesis glycosyltransferase